MEKPKPAAVSGGESVAAPAVPATPAAPAAAIAVTTSATVAAAAAAATAATAATITSGAGVSAVPPVSAPASGSALLRGVELQRLPDINQVYLQQVHKSILILQIVFKILSLYDVKY